MSRYICLQPCLGIASAASTIGRQGCYLAYQRLGAERAHLGCAPALYAKVDEDVEFILGDWVIGVESCGKACAEHLVQERGGKLHARVRVDELLKDQGFDLESLPREHAPLDHPAVVAVADEIVRVAAELAGGECL